MKRRFYLAYGSNLNIKQMQMRCPMANPVDKVILEGYELLFRGNNGSAVATVEPKPGSHVHGALWLITKEDEKALDVYEAFPRLYRKEMVHVRLGRRRMRVMAYVMNEGYPIAMPGRGYVNAIAVGYDNFGLPENALRKAICVSMDAVMPDVTPD